MERNRAEALESERQYNQGAIDSQNYALQAEYQTRRGYLVDELDNIIFDIDTNQSISGLIENKKRKKELEDAIRQLDMEYANSLDPQGAQARMQPSQESQQIKMLNDKIDKLNKRIKASENKTCQVNGNFTSCSDGSTIYQNR